MEIDYNIIGERLKRARISQGMTQEKLAEKLDVSVAYLSRVERGSSHINLTRLNQICAYLGISEGYILNGSSVSSKGYLDDEFNELLKDCPPEKMKLIYSITKVIIEN